MKAKTRHTFYPSKRRGRNVMVVVGYTGAFVSRFVGTFPISLSRQSLWGGHLQTLK